MGRKKIMAQPSLFRMWCGLVTCKLQVIIAMTNTMRTGAVKSDQACAWNIMVHLRFLFLRNK